MSAPTQDLRKSLPGLKRIIGHLRPHLRKQRPMLAGGMVALFAEVAFRLLEPWPLKYVVDAVIQPDAAQRTGILTLLLVAGVAVAAFAGLRALSAYVMTVCFALAGSRAMTQVRADVYAHLQRLSLRYHSKARVGDLITRMVGDIGRLQEVAVTAALPLVGNVVTLLGMSIVMVVLDWQLALIVLTAFPVFLLSSSRQGRKITLAARQQRRREGQLAGTAAETLGAIKVVQAYSLERVLQQQFASSNAKSLKDSVKASRLAAGLERRTDLLVGLATGAVLFAGGAAVVGGRLTPGELVVFISYLKGAFKPMRDLAKYTGRISKAAASGERVVDLLETEPEIVDAPHAVPAPRFRGEVRFESVSAAYEPGRLALDDVDLHVAAGARVGLVGPSGAGKSTLALLLLRLQDPVAGRVLVDGHDVRDLTLTSVREQVSVVLQESVLFATTVRENIRYGRPDASDEEVEQAARLANAHGFVSGLPQGYDTEMSERGSTLSGGQRQRIAIARAMLRDAPLIILDEATTGIDPEGQRTVVEALRRLTRDRTTFVISHDVGAVLDCDLVVWVEDGRLVEQGRPSDLLARRGSRFATLRPLPGPLPGALPARREDADASAS
ncbi:MAG: ABC transporter ATP-binding protein [Acidothermales bacterium]|nr:ABC transporter ATP-binding protein [Acidothermales bacterium]